MRLVIAMLAFALAAPASALKVEVIRQAQPLSLGGGMSDVEVISGVLFGRRDASTSWDAIAVRATQMGFAMKGEMPGGEWRVFSVPGGMSVQSALPMLASVTGIREAAPNHFIRPSRIPNDPFYSQQYHLGKVNAPAAWEYAVGDATNVTVAVLDAGVQISHPDLQAKMTGLNHQFCDPVDQTVMTDSPNCVAESPQTACNHGTRVAGVAAALTGNGVGVSGVSWGAKVLSMRVFRTADCTADCSAAGLAGCGTDDGAIALALHKLTTMHGSTVTGRIVANISLGYVGVAVCPAVIQTAINVAVSSGVVVVVAAGNEGGAMRPLGNCNNVIPVGATDSNDNVASFSNKGAELAANGLVAPGVALTTTDLGGGVTSGATGTSFSAPLVSGLAALIVSAKTSFTPADVKNTLRGSTDGIGVSAVAAQSAVPAGNGAGAGRVNAFKAVKLAVEGTLAGFAGDQRVIAFPNPFRTSQSGTVTITIPTSLQSKGTSIRVYTIDGQLVRDLKGQTTWDGKNDGGLEVASGTYLLLVKTDAGTQTGKVAVIR